MEQPLLSDPESDSKAEVLNDDPIDSQAPIVQSIKSINNSDENHEILMNDNNNNIDNETTNNEKTQTSKTCVCGIECCIFSTFLTILLILLTVGLVTYFILVPSFAQVL